jgi:choline/glycine/proline betaine transport protein
VTHSDNSGSRKIELGPLGLHVHPTVFSISALLIIAFIFVTLLQLDRAEALFVTIKDWLTATFGWLLILLVQGFLIFVVYLALSRFSQIRIGGPDARPDFSRPTWFAMLFSAGMGIGLMFYGVAEPVLHFQHPPAMEGGTVAAAARAMDLTFLHWGFHAWAIYAVVALALAYYSNNHALPLTVRSAFYPLLGERIHGPLGSTIDVMAVVATLFGVATSLGFGVTQINTGLNYLVGIPINAHVQTLLIMGITLVATASVVSGVNRGIRRLSEINLVAALVLLLVILIVGPTLFLMKFFVQSTGHYLQNILSLGSWTAAYQQDSEWQSNWTLFYWTWWIAWSPFVGMFIARISRGRTVREFILGVLLVPPVLTFLWFSVFGGAAISTELHEVGSVAAAVNENIATALFKLLEHFPLAAITSFLGIMLVFVFFITSSDSGSLVIDIITAGGQLDPPIAQRVFWAVTEGVVAAVLLAGGGLLALQTAAITTGLPFALILTLICFGLYRAFSKEVPRPARATHASDASGGD